MLRRTLLCFGAATLCAAHLSSSISLTRRGAMLSAAAAASASTVVVDANAEDSAPREVMTNVDVATGPGNKPVMVSRRRFTGAGDQGWTFPQTDLASSVLAQPFPNEWPYTDADFKRIDEEPDTAFYKFPKLVYHIDEGAVAALTRYYASNIPAGSDVLDICSSWVSHYPRGIGAFAGDDEDFKSKMKSIQATGISEIELKCNDQISSYKQADLNKSPKLPYPDRSMDVVTCVVSFDYLTRPREVMREIARVLRPGGKLILSQSNRCFYTKAVGAWTRDMSDPAHLRVLSTYIHFADSKLGTPRVLDISPRGSGTNDPMYIVEAVKM